MTILRKGKWEVLEDVYATVFFIIVTLVSLWRKRYGRAYHHRVISLLKPFIHHSSFLLIPVVSQWMVPLWMCWNNRPTERKMVLSTVFRKDETAKRWTTQIASGCGFRMRLLDVVSGCGFRMRLQGAGHPNCRVAISYLHLPLNSSSSWLCFVLMIHHFKLSWGSQKMIHEATKFKILRPFSQQIVNEKGICNYNVSQVLGMGIVNWVWINCFVNLQGRFSFNRTMVMREQLL